MYPAHVYHILRTKPHSPVNSLPSEPEQPEWPRLDTDSRQRLTGLRLPLQRSPAETAHVKYVNLIQLVYQIISNQKMCIYTVTSVTPLFLSISEMNRFSTRKSYRKSKNMLSLVLSYVICSVKWGRKHSQSRYLLCSNLPWQRGWWSDGKIIHNPTRSGSLHLFWCGSEFSG